MHRDLDTRPKAFFIYLLSTVIGRKHFLLDEVVEARAPFAGAQTRGGGAIVDHVGYASGVHVWVQRIDRFDDRLVAHLTVRMAVFEQQIDLRHHHRTVEAGGFWIERDLRLNAFGTHALPHTPHTRAVDLAHGVRLQTPSSSHDRAYFIARSDLFVDLLQEAIDGGIGHRVHAGKF